MTFKEEVYEAFRQVLAEKISQVQVVLHELYLSASNETKSTAGDKHETALAMLQLEQENKRRQLAELQLQKAVLNKINPTSLNTVISNGALVHTDAGYFFISVALGKITIAGKTVFALSISSPLGQALSGHRATEKISLNEKQYDVLNVE
jgi:transcription elongation GreA/GreB family factor